MTSLRHQWICTVSASGDQDKRIFYRPKMHKQMNNVISLSPDETWRIKKNVAVITVALMIHFTAINGAVNLQSSINAEAGLGTAALVAMFTGVLISNIFLTSVVIKWLGIKWTMCCSLIAAIPYIGFQMYPRFSTLVPTGILIGLGSGTKLCAKNTYIAVLAEAYSMLSKTPSSTILLAFAGFYFMIVNMSQFWGNLISSLVLSMANKASVTSVNQTMIPKICGSNFLPNLDAADALPTQPLEKIQTLAGIYIACILGAIFLIITALDSLKRYEFGRTASQDTLSGLALLAVTLKQLGDTNQQLLLAISIFVGFQQGFFYADFTVSFVSCAIGPGSVGYVMMALGSSIIVGCLVNAYLAKVLGRVPLICSAMVIHGGLLVTLLAWSPHAEDYYVMFIIAILWGFCDSVWVVQINTYYGILFRGKEEAAFSNLGLWEAVGFIISFALSSYVRTCYKIYLLFCSLIVGVLGYLIVEYRQKENNNQMKQECWRRKKRSPSKEDLMGELQRLIV